MVKISTIEINNEKGFFAEKQFVWSDIGLFSIITGINGSGKTQLLKYIANSDDLNRNCLIRYIDVNYRPPLEKHANEIENRFNHSLSTEEERYYATDKTGQRNDWTDSKVNFKNNSTIANLDWAIIDSLIKVRKKFNNNNTFIRNELLKIDNYEKTYHIPDLLPIDKNDDEPWDRIDRILNAFGLFIRLDRKNLNAGLGFLRRPQLKKIETSLEMSNLSSGEMQAFALALWTWGNSKGQKTDVLVIDEFDAHLNPSLAENFMNVIKEYFIDLGVQVIMTTHQPSTVAFAKKIKAEIIWMDDGIINREMAYENIIRILSNGLIDINYLLEDMDLLLINRHKIVIFTEGKTDKLHLKNAIKALGKQSDFENYFILGCSGADTVPFFMSLQTGQSKRIALLDHDDKGKQVYKKILENPELRSKIENKSSAVFFVSEQDNKVIEDLYEDEHRTIQNKEKFALHMSKQTDRSYFINFIPLLDQLLSLG